MLRKFSHILIFILLLTATTGMVISKHFCNNILISSSLLFDADSCCDDDCCQNRSEFHQLKEKFNFSEYAKIPRITEIGLLILEHHFSLIIFQKKDKPVLFTENDPPPPDINTILSLRQSYLL